MEELRLNKFISDSGICSRREADRLIENGHVFINGKRAKVGDKVLPGQKVMVNGQEIQRDTAYTYIMFNKPVGIVSTTDRSEKDNIVDYVAHNERIFPIGRLDKESQGLILMTNDGDIVNKILRAGNNHEKEYIVTVNRLVTEEFCKKMSQGVPVLGQHTKKCKVTQEAANVFRIVLRQGLNRQIRRMCEHFGYEVTKLERVRIMNLELGKLRSGQWRDLTPGELAALNELLKDSAKTAETPAKKKQETSQPASQKSNSNPRRDGKPFQGGKDRKKPFGKYGGGPSRNSGGRAGKRKR